MSRALVGLGLTLALAEAARVALAAELAPLGQIRGWEPVGSSLETFAAGEALVRADLVRLRTWASRWAALAPEARDFYATEVEQHGSSGTLPGCVEAALWAVLRGPGHAPLTGLQLGLLRARYASRYGREPAIELVPVIP